MTNAVNRDYAVPLYGALRADRPFLKASSGYAGTASDGLAQLDADHALATTYDEALDGNVVQTAQVDVGQGRPVHARARLRHAPRPRRRTRRRVARTHRSSRPRSQYEKTWRAYDKRPEPAAEDAARAEQARGRPAPVGVLAVGQRAEGQRGQDLPRRRGRLPRQPVGAGGQRGRHPGRQGRRTSAPTARCSPATSTSRSPACWPPAT